MHSSSTLHPSARARHGRALVELLVSSLLLSMAVAACLSLLRATSTFSDRVVRTGIARDITRDVSEQVQGLPCAMYAGTETRGRTEAAWTAGRTGALASVELHVTFPPLPFGNETVRSVSARAAGWCP